MHCALFCQHVFKAHCTHELSYFCPFPGFFCPPTDRMKVRDRNTRLHCFAKPAIYSKATWCTCFSSVHITYFERKKPVLRKTKICTDFHFLEKCTKIFFRCISLSPFIHDIYGQTYCNFASVKYTISISLHFKIVHKVMA